MTDDLVDVFLSGDSGYSFLSYVPRFVPLYSIKIGVVAVNVNQIILMSF
jgi:hypothetical protein